MKRRIVSALASAGLLVAVSATAQDASTLARAKMLFNAGARAYDGGQFNAAVQAFEEANRLYPKPAIVFSIAQAHKGQYVLDKNPEHLRAAIKNYRDYIAAQKEGGRIADAAQALAELEPFAARDAQPAVDKAPPKEPARIMVMTQIEGAQVTIDGQPAKVGLAVEVTPAAHRLVTAAPGYFTDDRVVTAYENALVPVDPQLREKPAFLSVVTDSGAQIAIDGRPQGTTPLATPIPVTSGAHLVTITKNGHLAHSAEMEFTRDEKKSISAPLESSGQRVASYALMLGGSAVVVAGAVFTGAAIVNQHQAQKILDRQTSGTITPQESDDYASSKKARDNWTNAAIAAYAVGGVTIASGLVLYLFDAPVVTAPPPRVEKKPAAPKDTIDTMKLVPSASPSFAGATVVGTF